MMCSLQFSRHTPASASEFPGPRAACCCSMPDRQNSPPPALVLVAPMTAVGVAGPAVVAYFTAVGFAPGGRFRASHHGAITYWGLPAPVLGMGALFGIAAPDEKDM